MCEKGSRYDTEKLITTRSPLHKISLKHLVKRAQNRNKKWNKEKKKSIKSALKLSFGSFKEKICSTPLKDNIIIRYQKFDMISNFKCRI